MRRSVYIRSFLLLVYISWICLAMSCKKYLDARSDKSLVIPTQVKELQGMMDQGVMYSGFPIGGATADDNFYYTYDNFATLSDIYSKAYVWDPNTQLTDDWRNCYSMVLNANIVLSAIDGLDDPSSSQTAKDLVKGSALFCRAFGYYEVAQLFAPPYTMDAAASGYGIPLKTDPNAGSATARSTLQQTYDKITGDLKLAASLLPDTQTGGYKTRPSRAACYGELARVYLSMSSYDSAYRYADLCLNIYDDLLDYNNSSDFAAGAVIPFQPFNNEVIYDATSTFLSYGSAQYIDTMFYSSYQDNDLRKQAFFTVNGDAQILRGTYSDLYYFLFAGTATDEVYLIRAECNARLGKVIEAMSDLNTLLVTRWKTGTFTPLSAADATEALNIILEERRKELVLRGSLRWTDLRRLNLDAGRKKTLTRVLNNQTYTLAPGDKRYTFLIPQQVIDLSGIEQNPR